MEWIPYVVAAVFALLGAGCLVLTVAGLPGTWILLGLGTVIELCDGYYLDEPVTFGWWALGGCVALALVGEGIEFAAGAAGTKAGGGSKRGMGGAIVGGLVGAIALTPWIPVPILGTLLGALIGTFVGALVAERSRAESDGVKADLKAAGGATAGRLVGTLAKTAVAAMIWVVLVVTAFWP